MAVPTQDNESADSVRLSAEAARIRADALASAQRLVEAARRSADELHDQAARQADAMVRAARAEVERLTEDANSRQVAQAVQQVSWDAPARVLEAATAEAELVRMAAEAQASELLREARRHAEREAEQLLTAAHARAEQVQQEAAAEVQQAWQELSQLQELGAARMARLAQALSQLSPAVGTGQHVAASPSGSTPPAAAAVPPVPTVLEPAKAALVADAVAPLERKPEHGNIAITSPAPRAAEAAAPMPAPVVARDNLPLGAVDLVLPERVDRITVEVMVAVLREQPGLTVRAATRRNQTLVIPVVVERPVPLIPILRELPRVAGAMYLPGAGSAGSGRVIIELDDR